MVRYVFILLLVLFFVKCDTKNEEGIGREVPLLVNNIVGEWQLEASKISIGERAEWKIVENGGVYTFELNGAYTYVINKDSKESGTYIFDNENKIISFNTNDKDETQNYLVKLGADKMILSPNGPVFCTDGCSYRYKKVK